ncbi:MAG: DUF302 domain-containing protein [Patescibacteria group bacterium]|nr:DUF302 domain-containing protein [Patescibacteria group bacterium]
MNNYGISKEVAMGFNAAVERVNEVLKRHGFGVLTKIDVAEQMKEKLEKEMGRYIILGACNPPSAYEAIQNDVEIGLLLPCNVIVYEKEGGVFVSAIKPTVAMGFVNNEQIQDIAKKIEKMLNEAMEEL